MTAATLLRPGVKRGNGSDERPVTRTLWDRDTQPAALPLKQEGMYEPDNKQVDYRRYYDADYFKQEIEKLWLKSWLFAGRDEDIPHVGDRMPLDVGPLSFMIVRSGEDEFKAFYNACLHRGTMLCTGKSSGKTIKCPYHAWEWNPDGTLNRIPSHWDFPSITRANGSLKEVKLDRWGGNLFINADPDSASLAEALLIVPDHLKDYQLENRYTAARFRKHVMANWKTVQEAFMESYHLLATHPEAVPYNGDSQTKYDIWTGPHGHVGRNATPSAVPSMHAPPDATPHMGAAVFAQSMVGWHYPNEPVPQFAPDQNPRVQAAQWHREVMERTYGHKVTSPDAVMLDSLLYFVFPHCTFWLSEPLPFTYQFTPHPTDPNQSYFEVRMMLPCPKDQPRPPSCETVLVGPDERVFEKAPGFGVLGYVFDQDMSNMPMVQRGCRAADPAAHHSELGSYQEILVQYWNELFDRYLAR